MGRAGYENVFYMFYQGINTLEFLLPHFYQKSLKDEHCVLYDKHIKIGLLNFLPCSAHVRSIIIKMVQ